LKPDVRDASLDGSADGVQGVGQPQRLVPVPAPTAGVESACRSGLAIVCFLGACIAQAEEVPQG
jgi:hypothetical protein